MCYATFLYVPNSASGRAILLAADRTAPLAAPTLSSSLTPPPVCSRVAFNYIPTSSTAGASFTWTRAAVPGISNPAGSGTGAVGDTLDNTTNNAITVTYQFTISTGTVSNVEDVQVIIEPTPQASFTVSATSECLTGNSFTFNSTSTIGTGSISHYFWYLGDGGSDNATSFTYSYATPGSFVATLICESAAGCLKQTQQTVVVDPQPVAAFTYTLLAPYNTNDYQFNDQSVDGSSAITATAWNFGDGTTSNVVPTVPHQYGAGGTYNASLTVTNANGCSSTVTEPLTTPTVGAGGQADFTITDGGTATTGECLGAAFTFTDNTQATAAETGWTWNFGDGTPTSNVQAPPPHTYATAGYYTVTLTVTFSDGTTSKVSQSLSVFPTPTLILLPSTNQVVCSGGGSKAVYFKPATDGLQYTWTSSNPAVGIPSGSGANFPGYSLDSVTASISTTVDITAKSPYACFIADQTFTISVNPLPAITGAFPSQTVCSGTEISEPAFVSTLPATTYSWTNTNPVTGLAASGTGDIPAFAALNYSTTPVSSLIVFRPTAGGCTGYGRATSFTVYPTPAVLGMPSDTGICSGTLFNYTATASLAGTSYSWTRDSVLGLQQGADSGVTSISETLTNETSGPLTVPYLFTLRTSTCSAVDMLNVILAPALTLSSVLDTGLCNGTALTYTPTSPVAGATLSWARAAVPGISNAPATGSGTVRETLNSTDTAAVTVPYTYTIQADGCSANQVVDVVINPIPTLGFGGSASQTLCPGIASTPVDWAVVPYGTPVQWTNNNANIGLGLFGTGNVPSFTAVDASTTPISGNLGATARTAAGCSSAPLPNYTITVDPSPTAVLDTPSGTLLCPGGTLPLQATGGTTYQWTLGGQVIGGQTGPALSATQPGIYTVTAYTGLGCGDSAEASISLIPNPSAGFSYATSCQDTPVVFTNMSTATVPVTYLWTDNDDHVSSATNPVFTYTGAGTYTVNLIVTPDGCASLAEAVQETISITTPPPGTALPRIFVVTGKATPLVAPSYPNAAYLWAPAVGLSSDTVMDPDATLTGDQAYAVTITLASGCVMTDTLQVDMIAPDVVYIPSAFTPNGDGHNDLFVIAGLNNYPGSALMVFNRWGNRVYTSSSYNNDWDGGDQPPGTYVYVLQVKFPDRYELKKGWLEIIR